MRRLRPKCTRVASPKLIVGLDRSINKCLFWLRQRLKKAAVFAERLATKNPDDVNGGRLKAGAVGFVMTPTRPPASVGLADC